jgi:hypothetical protein
VNGQLRFVQKRLEPKNALSTGHARGSKHSTAELITHTKTLCTQLTPLSHTSPSPALVALIRHGNRAQSWLIVRRDTHAVRLLARTHAWAHSPHNLQHIHRHKEVNKGVPSELDDNKLIINKLSVCVCFLSQSDKINK